MSVSNYSSQLAIDVKGLNDLKREARANTPTSYKAVAQQFEALFLQTVLKTMRDATPHDGLFDSEQTRMYESMLDQQLTQSLATRGGGTGLAALIEKQLARVGSDPQPLGALPLHAPARGLPLPAGGLRLPQSQSPAPASRSVPAETSSIDAAFHAASVSSASGLGARDFVERIWSHAADASRATGIPAHFMVAQAALETGWGKSEPRFADGSPSYNLFGIKAGRGWAGRTVAASTNEVVDGQARRQVEQFRAYGSYAEAFRDYASLLTSAPRYADVLGAQDATTFANGLQRAGYASDPLYADKLTRIIGGSTLRASLLG